MADLRRPYLTTVRPRNTEMRKIPGRFNFYLPKLRNDSSNSSKGRNSKSRIVQSESFNLPNVLNPHENLKPKRRNSRTTSSTIFSKMKKTTSEVFKTEGKSEVKSGVASGFKSGVVSGVKSKYAPITATNNEEKPTFGFGVVMRISRFMSRARKHSLNRKEAEALAKIMSNNTSSDIKIENTTFSEEEKKKQQSGTNFSSKSHLQKSDKNNLLAKSEVFVNQHSTLMPLPSSKIIETSKKPLLKTRSSNALLPISSRMLSATTNNSSKVSSRGSPTFMTKLTARDKVLQRQASWGFLRNRLVNAKISDAFSQVKFTINGTTLRALRCIGEGGYAKVYEVFNDSNELFALKVVDLNNTRVKESLMDEIAFLDSLKDCDKVINMNGHEKKDNVDGLPFSELTDYDPGNTGGKCWLFVLLERGEIDLEKIIKKLKFENRLTPTKIRFYWEQMLEAVAQIHDKGVIHADLKPANFLQVSSELKLIDFGLACRLEADQDTVKRRFVAGTKDYLSPELFSTYVIEDGVLNLEAMKNSKHKSGSLEVAVSPKSDVWALGIILYQWIYQQNHPYDGLPGGKYTRIQALSSLDVPIHLDSISDPFLWDTIRLCLEKRPENRPSVKDLLNHPYLKPIAPIDLIS